jgi:hypothetical protein
MTVLKHLVVSTGEYQDSSGETKKRWRTIGQLHEAQDGRQYVTIDALANLAAIPRKEGEDRVYASLFDPPDETRGRRHGVGQAPARQERPAQPRPRQVGGGNGAASGAPVDADEIPF